MTVGPPHNVRLRLVENETVAALDKVLLLLFRGPLLDELELAKSNSLKKGVNIFVGGDGNSVF